jgi:CHRD domain
MTIGTSCRGKERMMKPTAILVALVAALATAGAAYAQELKFEAELSGAAERPTPVMTDGVGEAKFESDGTSVEFELKWDDLTTPAFAAHIHCGGRQEAGPVGVTLFAAVMDTEGEVQGTFTAPDAGNMCDWADLADVLEAMATGDAYTSMSTPRNIAEARSAGRWRRTEGRRPGASDAVCSASWRTSRSWRAVGLSSLRPIGIGPSGWWGCAAARPRPPAGDAGPQISATPPDPGPAACR